MKVPRPTDADKNRFRSLVPEGPGVEVKPMFGNLAAFVNGNMFAGLFGSAIGVKLAEADHAELARRGGGPYGPEERPMGGYLTLPAGLSAEEAAGWVERARAHAATLPPKPAKK
ncbi:MAG TPA: TfoX/Sxy family protein [Jiangellales bacterium]|nr:TfoX/Sxy family protein [Jiangellales bacterium]